MPGTRPDRVTSVVNGQTTNFRDPYALLGVKRSDSDAQVRAGFLRARALHDPANGGSDEANREVVDAYARICAERGIAPEAPDTPIAVQALAAAVPEAEQVVNAEAVAGPSSVPPPDIVALSSKAAPARKAEAA